MESKRCANSSLGAFAWKRRQILRVGVNCTKDILVGASCEWLADKMGTSYADTAHALLDSGATAKAFEKAVNTAYNSKACTVFQERLSKATRHAKGTGTFGTDCQSGQFWDPNGYCYSCPQGFTRTLEPVDGSRACVDKFGGELVRSACSVYVALDSMLGDSAKCTVEILESGVFINKEMDFALASRDVCMSTGEFVYAMLDLTSALTQNPEKKTAKLEKGLKAYIDKIKNSKMYQNGRIIIQTAGTAGKGKTMIDKLQELPHCR